MPPNKWYAACLQPHSINENTHWCQALKFICNLPRLGGCSYPVVLVEVCESWPGDYGYQKARKDAFLVYIKLEFTNRKESVRFTLELKKVVSKNNEKKKFDISSVVSILFTHKSTNLCRPEKSK